MGAAVVYRAFDAYGSLLYVGCTVNLAARLSAHNGRRPEWAEVSWISCEHHDTIETAIAAEAAAVRSEHPRWNVQHSIKPPRERRTGRPLGRPQGLTPRPDMFRVFVRRYDSQLAAATDLGISPSKLSEILSGKARCSEETSRRIAEHLRVDVSDLFKVA